MNESVATDSPEMVYSCTLFLSDGLNGPSIVPMISRLDLRLLSSADLESH